MGSHASTPVLCGVDIGSTNTKATVLGLDGDVLATASRATPRSVADPSIDARSLLETVEEMLLQLCADGRVAQAVAVAGVGEDGMLVDDALQPLVPALAWFDPRREQVRDALLDRLEPVEELPVATESSRTVFGWRWAALQPDAERAVAWVALADYPAVVWSGRVFMSDTLAARTAAWSPTTRAWIGSRVDVSLGDRALLPPVLRTGTVVGPWHSRRLLEAGIVAPDAVVVAGGHDHPLAGWGVHRMRPGAVLDSMGTAEVVVTQSAEPLVPRESGLDVAPGIRQPGSTLLSVQELARNMEWAGRDPSVGEALRRIVSGERAVDQTVDPTAFRPGAPGGAAPAYTSDAPDEPHARASAVALALADAAERAVQRVGSHAASDAAVFVAGGWTRSPGWLEVKRGRSRGAITVLGEPEVTAVSAAVLAGEAAGLTPDAQLALAPAVHA